LATIGKRTPARHDARRDSPLRVERGDLLLLSVPALLRDQLGETRLLVAAGESDPGEHEVHLEVAQFLWAELRLLGEQVDLPQIGPAFVEQLRVPRHRPDPDLPIGGEIGA
jgi:hypothetical protein